MQKEQIAVLVRKAQAGDGQAMSELLELAYSSVMFQCRKIMAHPEDAEDMAQEVLIRIYEKLDTLQEPEKFLSWANSIAARLCINERQRNPKDLQFAEDEEGNSVLDNLEDMDRQNVPDAAIDNEETRRMIVELIDALPEAQRTATYLYYYDEMSVKEIAEIVGVPENTVKSRLNYARKAIKEGVLGYEKKGVKLYGLSPLPFLLYFLRGSAESSADTAVATAAAKTVLAAEGVGVAAAEGIGAGSASAGSAVSAASSAGSAAGASGTAAATNAAAGAAVKGAGILGSAAAKITAGVLTVSLAAGGIGLAISSRSEPAPVEPSPVVVSVEPSVEPSPIVVSVEPTIVPSIEPSVEPSVEPSDGPVEIAEYTTIRTTVETGLDNVVIYLETPLFEETGEGYRKINELFAEIHAEFESGTEPNIAWILAHLDEVTPEHRITYIEVHTVDSQDGETVKVNHEWEWTSYRGDKKENEHRHWSVVPLAFDARTGEITSRKVEANREAFKKRLLEDYGTDSFEEVTKREDYGRNHFTIYYRHQFGNFGT